MPFGSGILKISYTPRPFWPALLQKTRAARPRAGSLGLGKLCVAEPPSGGSHPVGVPQPFLHTKPRSAWGTCGRGSKNRYQNGTLVSGNMDQNLRNPSCFILSHTHVYDPKFTSPSTLGSKSTWDRKVRPAMEPRALAKPVFDASGFTGQR